MQTHSLAHILFIHAIQIINSAKKVSKSLCENFDSNIEEKNRRSK